MMLPNTDPATTHVVYAYNAETKALLSAPFTDEQTARNYHAMFLLDGHRENVATVAAVGAAAPVWFTAGLVAKEARLVHEIADVAERAFLEHRDRTRPECWTAVARAVISHPMTPRVRAIEEALLRG